MPCSAVAAGTRQPDAPMVRIRKPRRPDVDESGSRGRAASADLLEIVDNSLEGPDSSHDRRMMLRKASADDLWLPVATAQHGLISRRQLIGLGLTPSQARTNVTNGRWQRVHPGVYATFTGTLDPLHRVWAALLYAGQDAVACCATSLWLFGLLERPPETLHVSIPESRRVDPLPGIRPHRRRVLDRPETPVHPAASPPRIRIEESLLDECTRRTEAEAVGLILRATQRRLTTPARVTAALSRRAVQPWRTLIRDVLADAEAGVASPLELHYRRRVEGPHGLPIGQRNAAEVDGAGGRKYRDVDYRRWRLVIELDGQGAHPRDEVFRDLRRDNQVSATDRTTFRYGWHDVVGEPCTVAAQVGIALKQRGWLGTIRPCGPDCPIPPSSSPQGPR